MMQPSARAIVPGEFEFEHAKAKRTCHCCRQGIAKGTKHLAVYVVRSMPSSNLRGKRRCRENYCANCAEKTLRAAADELHALGSIAHKLHTEPVLPATPRLPNTPRAIPYFGQPDTELNWQRIRREKIEAGRRTAIYTTKEG